MFLSIAPLSNEAEQYMLPPPGHRMVDQFCEKRLWRQRCRRPFRVLGLPMPWLADHGGSQDFVKPTLVALALGP